MLHISEQNFHICNFLFVEAWIYLYFIQSVLNYTIFSICFYPLLKISHPTAKIIKFAMQFFKFQQSGFYSQISTISYSAYVFLLLFSISFNSNAMVNLAIRLKDSILEVLYRLLTRFGFLYKYVYICTYMCLYSWSNLGVSFWICIGNYL